MVDESYLLRIITHPEATRQVGEVHLFGFVLHPRFEFVGRDVGVCDSLAFEPPGLMEGLIPR